jgi:Ca2+-binding RTX toxin-like protein
MRTLIAAVVVVLVAAIPGSASAATFRPTDLFGGISRQDSGEGEVFINVRNRAASKSKLMFARFAFPTGLRTNGDVVVPGGVGACNAPDDHTIFCRDMNWRPGTDFGIAFSTDPPMTTNQGMDLFVSVDGVTEFDPYRLTGPAAVKLMCGGRYPYVVGTSGNDTFIGTSGPDIFVGAGGKDRILGKGGNDVLCGNTGVDTINGGAGGDEIYGGTAGDVLLGLGGADWMDGEAGNDTVDGGSGDDIVHGGAGRDVVRGGANRDQLFGNAGKDRLTGGRGSDACTGGTGKDRFAACESKVQ